MSPTLEVTRVTIDQAPAGKENEGHKPQLRTGKTVLLWAQVAFISECDLATNFAGYEIEGPGTYIYCSDGYGFYCRDEYPALAATFVQWQQSAQAAPNLYFKAN